MYSRVFSKIKKQASKQQQQKLTDDNDGDERKNRNKIRKRRIIMCTFACFWSTNCKMCTPVGIVVVVVWGHHHHFPWDSKFFVSVVINIGAALFWFVCGAISCLFFSLFTYVSFCHFAVIFHVMKWISIISFFLFRIYLDLNTQHIKYICVRFSFFFVSFVLIFDYVVVVVFLSRWLASHQIKPNQAKTMSEWASKSIKMPNKKQWR